VLLLVRPRPIPQWTGIFCRPFIQQWAPITASTRDPSAPADR